MHDFPIKKMLPRFLPILLASIGAFLLVGCIYLPIPEHKVSQGPDFRDLLGRENSNRPIRAGAITRAQVIRRLGSPDYRSDDGSAIGYTLRTEIGLAIWPACFAAGADQEGAYAVRLTFDKRDVLADWEMAHDVTPFGAFGLINASPEPGAIKKLNEHGPELLTPGQLQAKSQR